MKKFRVLFFLSLMSCCFAKVKVGLDVFFSEGIYQKYKNKKIGLITNHTGVDGKLKSSIYCFKQCKDLQLKAIFCPEHGLDGSHYASEKITNNKEPTIPIYSLHGTTKRPTLEMLKDIDVLIYDIQCIGSRSYTYITTLFYAMEEASKYGIEVIVLDRPNPIGGNIIDGPILDADKRSFIGYINVPYCHGMTIGELAQYFNSEYNIKCSLNVIAMNGWKRDMSYSDTGLHWVPPSPHIPEPDTPFYYPSTGILGELNLISIGIGYTLPFKIVGAPWIQSSVFSEKLNLQNLPGVLFLPFSFKPFYGLFKGQTCHGIKIVITDYKKYRPIAVQFAILGILKTLYPEKVEHTLKNLSNNLFIKALGNVKALDILKNEKYVTWKLIDYQKTQVEDFRKKRKKYLIPCYQN
jgi:uncharacterized protein YbbC (DUF1343 family)